MYAPLEVLNTLNRLAEHDSKVLRSYLEELDSRAVHAESQLHLEQAHRINVQRELQKERDSRISARRESAE